MGASIFPRRSVKTFTKKPYWRLTMRETSSGEEGRAAPIPENREKAFSIVMYVCACLLLIGWPISHVFFAKWYMQAVGFTPGSYTLSQTQLTGANGLLSVLLLLYLGFSPKRKWGLVLVNSVFLLLFVAMFLYQILTKAFPNGLLPIAILLFVLAVLIPTLYFLLIEKPNLESTAEEKQPRTKAVEHY
jgi:hypothetical protein